MHQLVNNMGLTKEYLERPHQGISAMWGRYLESGEYSDFLVTCANREFHVHRLVICPRSSYFRLVCKESFKEGITQKLDLVDEDPDVFQSVLTFLYTGIYETCKITGCQETGTKRGFSFSSFFRFFWGQQHCFINSPTCRTNTK